MVLTQRKGSTRPTIIIIMTDGHDNHSKARPQHILPLVHQLSTTNCFFVFLGADLCANIIGGKMGIQQCVLYNNTPASIQKASEAINIAIAQACHKVTGVPNPLSQQQVPDDVRELMNSLDEMKI
jgi:hypothetical protein